jgi:hypothetical protein
MSPLKEYTAKTVFVPATLLLVSGVLFLIFFVLRQKGVFNLEPYSIFLVITGVSIAISSFLVAYNACLLQFSRFKNIGFVFGFASFGLVLFYTYLGLWESIGNPGIYQTLYHYFYASIALLLLSALSEFHSLLKYLVGYAILLFSSAIITSRSVLTPELVSKNPFLEKFVDSSFWNLLGIVITGLSIGLLLYCSHLVVDKFKHLEK